MGDIRGFDVEKVRALAAYEDARNGLPEGFPKDLNLPLEVYYDPSYLKSELDNVFMRNWLYMANVSQLPKKGSYVAIDLPIAPIILVRGNDEKIRAFVNSCKHRGATVVPRQCGEVKRLTCQYHAWTFDLEGRLISVPEDRDFGPLDYEALSLTEVRCESWGNFIFINFDKKAPALSDWLSTLDSRFSDVTSADMVLIESASQTINANWKAVLDAFIETYHVGVIHKQTAAPVINLRQTSIELYPNGHSCMYMPLRPDAVAGLAATWGKGVEPIEGLGKGYHAAAVNFSVFPNCHITAEPQCVFMLVCWPLAVDKTRFDVYFFGKGWGGGPRPDVWDEKLMQLKKVFAEDMLNLDSIQKSMASSAGTGSMSTVPISYMERRLWHYHAEVARQIGAKNAPGSLQDPDKLTRYVVVK